MSGSAKEWIIVIAFFVGFFLMTFAEAAWLNKKTGTSFIRSFGLAFVPNIFTVTVGFAFSAVVFFLILMIVYRQDVEGSRSEATLWFALSLALIAPVAILVFGKRVAIMMMKLDSVRSPWLYSLATSLLFFFVTLSLPIAIAVVT